jgi:hypothetical protein
MLSLDPRLLTPSRLDGRTEDGVFSFIVRHPEVVDILAQLYHRPNLCLKIFKQLYKPLPDFCWGKNGVPLTECTVAQNLLAYHAIAPRVYDIILVNNRWAQVTDYVTDDGKTFDRQFAHRTIQDHHVRKRSGMDMNPYNWIGSRMVDFQMFTVADDYLPNLKSRITAHAAWGSRSEPYQDIAGLDTPSQRDTPHRLTLMQPDWEDKTILDIGCNLGEFCRVALRNGARRAIGIDLPHVAELAYEVSNYLHIWNCDFVGLRLPSQKDLIPALPYDITLCLSANQTKPIPWVFYLAPTLYYEGHVPDKETTYRPTLEQHFSTVTFLGATRDHGPRPLFYCTR